MKAEIKCLYSPDVYDLKNYCPPDEECFGFLLRLMVGERGKEGEESFDMILCTPKWLSANNKKQDVLFGLHYLIVFRYDYDLIFEKLRKYVESINGKNWDEIGQKIGLIGNWEFQDYREFGSASK